MTNSYENFDEQVDLFLKKKMTEQEEQEFLAVLKNDPELLKRAQTIALMIQQMDVLHKEREQPLRESLKKMAEHELAIEMAEASFSGVPEPADKETSDTSKPVSSSSNHIWRYLAAACVALLLIFGGYRYHQNSLTKGLGDAYFDAVEFPATARGIITNKMLEMTDLFDNVATETDIGATAKRLEEIYNESIGETYNDYTPYAATIGWMAAIAYLKDGDRKSARAILVSLKERNKGKAVADKAAELIEKIDNI